MPKTEAPDREQLDEQEKHFAAFLQHMIHGEHAALAETLHPDVRWHLPPFSGQEPIVGVSEVLRFLRDGAAAIYQPDSLSLEPELLSVRAGKASCLATIRGRLRDGRPYENRYAFFGRMAEGHITEVWEILDSALLLKQLEA